MIKTIFIFLSSFLYVSLHANNIVQIHQSMPNSIVFNYRPIYQGNTWVSKYDTKFNKILFKIDIINGYMQIIDRGTGGSTLIQTFALFIDKKGSRFIALTESVTGSWTRVYRKFKIYQIQKKLWIDVTNSIFPTIDINSFLKEKLSLSEILRMRMAANIISFLDYKLPQYGTTIAISIKNDYSEEFIRTRSLSDQILLKKLLHLVYRKSVNIFWNYDAGLFYMNKPSAHNGG